MKKIVAIALIALPLVFISCKSTEQEEAPAEKTPVVDEKPVEQPADQNQDKTAEIEGLFATAAESRNKAVAAGADRDYADQLKKADDIVAALRDRYNNSEDVSAELKDANYRYLALEKAALTKKLKADIEENGFDQKNKIAYEAAGALLEKLEEALMAGESGAAMYEAANAAYAAYYAIFYDSFKKLAQEERDNAKTAKNNADSVKAAVARKDAYKAAVDQFKKGDTHFVTKNPQGAYECYKQSAQSFTALYTEVKEKREAAQKAIDEAKSKVQNIEEYAVEADKKAPIEGEKMDGIEDEGTVLLEEDKFQKPEDAEIKVEENVTVENDSVIDVLKDKISE